MTLPIPRSARFRFPAVLLPLALLALQAGCGSDGPERYPLSGDVTYGGRPVAAGTILFAPDKSKNNDGPGTFVEFVDGHYATLRGKGTAGGPHRVIITGYTGTPHPSGEAPYGLPIFSEYVLEVDLPHEKATQDFAVPGTHR